MKSLALFLDYVDEKDAPIQSPHLIKPQTSGAFAA